MKEPKSHVKGKISGPLFLSTLYCALNLRVLRGPQSPNGSETEMIQKVDSLSLNCSRNHNFREKEKLLFSSVQTNIYHSIEIQHACFLKFTCKTSALM